MTKHTPGPWHTTKPIESNGYVWVDPSDGCCGDVATAWPTHQGSAEANANLIAAAPELLEALEAARRKIEWILPVEWDVMRQIDAAIAKATGEQL